MFLFPFSFYLERAVIFNHLKYFDSHILFIFFIIALYFFPLLTLSQNFGSSIPENECVCMHIHSQGEREGREWREEGEGERVERERGWRERERETESVFFHGDSESIWARMRMENLEAWTSRLSFCLFVWSPSKRANSSFYRRRLLTYLHFMDATGWFTRFWIQEYSFVRITKSLRGEHGEGVVCSSTF